MKRIETKAVRERKKKRNRILIGVLLAIIMLFSTLGYAFYSRSNNNNENEIKYRGIKFKLGSDGYWHFNIKNYGFATVNNPNMTKNVFSNITINLNNYNGENIYFEEDSYQVAVLEIARNLARFVSNNPMQKACLDEEDCEGDFPIKNCSRDNIIIIQENNSSEIVQKENCVFIRGKKEDLIKLSDAFIYRILGLN